MRIFLAVLPTVLLVVYSQVIVKWRVGTLSDAIGAGHPGMYKYIMYLFDPFILSAYVAGLIGSFAWLFTVSKLPLALAFPVYQGLTFLLVVIASAIILNEPMTSPKIIGICMILGGVIVGTRG
jgi:multidrug transporter EmrE-like cation transporter